MAFFSRWHDTARVQKVSSWKRRNQIFILFGLERRIAALKDWNSLDVSGGPVAKTPQEYWSGVPLPSPGDRPNPGIESPSPALQEDSLLVSFQGSPWLVPGSLCKSAGVACSAAQQKLGLRYTVLLY